MPKTTYRPSADEYRPKKKSVSCSYPKTAKQVYHEARKKDKLRREERNFPPFPNLDNGEKKNFFAHLFPSVNNTENTSAVVGSTTNTKQT